MGDRVERTVALGRQEAQPADGLIVDRHAEHQAVFRAPLHAGRRPDGGQDDRGPPLERQLLDVAVGRRERHPPAVRREGRLRGPFGTLEPDGGSGRPDSGGPATSPRCDWSRRRSTRPSRVRLRPLVETSSSPTGGVRLNRTALGAGACRMRQIEPAPTARPTAASTQGTTRRVREVTAAAGVPLPVGRRAVSPSAVETPPRSRSGRPGASPAP